MIIQTGMRTDIPAFYSQWFTERLKEGYVLVRNPYNPTSVTRYNLNPDVVDLIGFCTKNPTPMLPYMDLLGPYGQYWFVTITPYGKDIEPNVPDCSEIMDAFCRLSDIVGINSIGWRYDPIIINEDWDAIRHIESFRRMADRLDGYTDTCIISFIDLYEKVKRNYPEVRPVSREDRIRLTKAFVDIGKKHNMTIKPCGEGTELSTLGADCSGCMTVQTYERAIGKNLNIPYTPAARSECACYLSGDIGQYNTCSHLCRYCYANSDADAVRSNMRRHEPDSPLLIGHLMPEDTVRQAKQKSWIDPQLRLDVFGV